MTGDLIPVCLTIDEIRRAAMEGVRRQLSALEHKRVEVYGATSNPWEVHINGCIAELAVAKHYGLEWSGNFDNLQADDAGRLQVRSTPHHPDGYLAIHPPDANDKPFVLVTGRAPTVYIRGWLYGREGKRAGYWADKWRTGRPAFWIPATALRAMADLPAIWTRRDREPGDEGDIDPDQPLNIQWSRT